MTYMAHAEKLIADWRREAEVSSNQCQQVLWACAGQLERALRKDQHDLFHDAEFYSGCDICDKERELHS